MTAIVPGFTYRQIPRNYSTERWDYSLGLVLHVATGSPNSSLYGWFSSASAQASSHWWVGASGTREQYLDPENHVSWAQAGGNSLYHSVETGGEPVDPLTEAQCQAVADIYRWGHERFGWPYQLAETPGERGLGWHGMGGAAWGGHTGCPGELRKAQRQHILDLAQGGTTIITTNLEDLMATLTDNQRDALLADVHAIAYALTDGQEGVKTDGDVIGQLKNISGVLGTVAYSATDGQAGVKTDGDLVSLIKSLNNRLDSLPSAIASAVRGA